MTLNLTSRNKMHEGFVEKYSHTSTVCGGAEMNFSIFLPPSYNKGPLPVLYFLSGLTCNEDTFMFKSGAQQHAARLGLILVAPDTSPRNLGIEGETERWDFGAGASFYVNATQSPWSKHYHMYDYITQELPEIINTKFNVEQGRSGIFGHSMGGHGALVIALRNPGRFQSVSAFSPIAAPTQCPWGEYAFSRYLGDNKDLWLTYDTSYLIEQSMHKTPILIDQGQEDKFLKDQLKPQLLTAAADKRSYPLTLRMQPGYDHSYFFVASFIKEHLEYHMRHLTA